MPSVEDEHHPHRFQLFRTELRDHFAWKFLLGANFLDEIAALVITEVNASN